MSRKTKKTEEKPSKKTEKAAQAEPKTKAPFRIHAMGVVDGKYSKISVLEAETQADMITCVDNLSTEEGVKEIIVHVR